MNVKLNAKPYVIVIQFDREPTCCLQSGDVEICLLQLWHINQFPDDIFVNARTTSQSKAQSTPENICTKICVINSILLNRTYKYLFK